jgi:hypothetical protein
MKLLLDECLPLNFRRCFSSHEAHTAEWAGFKGLKNGQLLQKAEASGYEVFLTVDKGVAYQNNRNDRRIAVVIVAAPSNQLVDLLPAVDAILLALREIQPGQAYLVSATSGVQRV